MAIWQNAPPIRLLYGALDDSPESHLVNNWFCSAPTSLITKHFSKSQFKIKLQDQKQTWHRAPYTLFIIKLDVIQIIMVFLMMMLLLKVPLPGDPPFSRHTSYIICSLCQWTLQQDLQSQLLSMTLRLDPNCPHIVPYMINPISIGSSGNPHYFRAKPVWTQSIHLFD